MFNPVDYEVAGAKLDSKVLFCMLDHEDFQEHDIQSNIHVH